MACYIACESYVSMSLWLCERTRVRERARAREREGGVETILTGVLMGVSVLRNKRGWVIPSRIDINYVWFRHDEIHR